MLERWMLVGIIVLWRQPASALSEKTEDSQRLRGTRKTEAALKRMRNKGSLKERARAGKLCKCAGARETNAATGRLQAVLRQSSPNPQRK